MSVIDRIKSIAKKLNIKVEGETIVELLDSLETGIDGRIDKKPVTASEPKTVMSAVREAYTPKPKKNKRSNKVENEDDE